MGKFLHKRKLIGPMASLCAVLGSLAVTTACSKPEPIRIGFIGGLSSRTSDLGISSLNGAILATEMRNASGGINGRRIELVIRDDYQNKSTAIQSVGELIDNIKVDAIIGPLTSDMSIATAQLANKAKVVMISPTSTTNELSGKDDYFFRVLSPTTKYASISGRFHRTKLKYSRVAVAYDMNNSSYSKSWLTGFRSAFVKDGGVVSLERAFYSDINSNFPLLAKELVGNRPDGILIIASSIDVALLCKHIRMLSPRMPISASDWAGTEQLVELGGKSINGLIFTHYIDRFGTQPEYVRFRQKYLLKFGHEPGYAGITTYDAANVLFEALSRKRKDQDLKDAILSIRTFDGLQDPIVFNGFGEAERKVFMSVVKDGQFTTYAQ